MKYLLIFFLIIINLVSCSVKPLPICINGLIEQQRGICGIFTEQWHEHYKRALEFKEGECYKFAITDLNAAIKIKPYDKRWVNTYGMHFIDYFPHREKGIALYFIGEFKAAKEELTLSISQESSSKACYFLDLVRKKIIQSSLDKITVPAIYVKYNNKEVDKNRKIITNKNYFKVCFEIFDPLYVSKITINNKQLMIESSSKKLFFERFFKMNQGTQQIIISAENLMGGTSVRIIDVKIDRGGPVIIIKSKQMAGMLAGSVHDDSPVDYIAVNGVKKTYLNKKKIDFNVFVKKSRNDYILIETADILGNITKYKLKKDLTVKKNYYGELFLNSYGLFDIKKDARLFCNFSNKPDIYIENLDQMHCIYNDTLLLSGKIISKIPFKKVILEIYGENQEQNQKIFILEMHNNTESFLLFNQKINLFKGQNRILLSIYDNTEEISKREYIIKKLESEVYKKKYRYKLMICIGEWMDFIDELTLLKQAIKSKDDKLSANLKHSNRLLFHNFFRKSLDESGRFQLKLRKELKKLLSRFNYIKTGKPKTDKKDKKPVNALLFCDTAEDKDGIEIAVRVVDIKTRRVLSVKHVKSLDVYSGSKTYQSVKTMAEILSCKLVKEFPFISGNLKKENDTMFFVNLKERDSNGTIYNSSKIKRLLRTNWPLFVYRKKTTDCGTNTKIINTAYIDGVMESKKERIPVSCYNMKKPIASGDMVITQ